MNTSPTRRRAFTLPELLLVMLVISILLGLLLSAIRMVHRHTLQTVTRGELKGIEAALVQYFAHYQTWPAWPTNVWPSADREYVLDDQVARALQGAEESSDYGINPDRIPFMEFARLDRESYPVNAWGEGVQHGTNCRYRVKFDHDGDNKVIAPAPDNSVVRRGVIVWTHNPEEPDAAVQLLGSWKE